MMSAFHSRLYGDPTDAARIVEFVRRVRPRERVTDYPGIVDLPDVLTPVSATTRLWFAADDQIVGVAFVDAFQTLRFELDWQRIAPDLEAAVIAWGDGCIRRASGASSDSLRIYAAAHEADAARLRFLARHAFTRLADSIIHMERPLIDPLPAPRLPPGFQIRAVAGLHEAAALAALHRAAFGTPHMSAARRLTMMQAAHYDPALDLVAIAPDGTPAAYGMGSVSSEENALTGRNDSYADLFATLPAYRGKGLAQALMLTILQKLRARGLATAKLSTASNNSAMQRVASSAGFKAISATVRLQRAIAVEPPAVG
ncbi:MAG TPA: GNAT family N-acetyltransferase [Herpetosiphonaceae bacterium]